LQRLLSTATIVGLLIATAAAFAITERLKLVKSPVTGTKISAVFSPAHAPARIRVKLRHSDRVTLTVLTSGQKPVRTLVADELRRRGENVFSWNGRTDLGGVARQGVYLVEIHLAHQHRTILFPNRIVLDTTTPEVLDATPNREQFSPDGDHQADSVRIRYKLSKEAHVLVYLGGRRILRTRSHKPEGHVEWSGQVNGQLLPAGTYTLTVTAVDLAGNPAPASQTAGVTVEIRYITLASARITGIKAGTRFDIGVSTDAKRYRWRLGARSGFAHGPVLRLRAPASPGRYPLTVTEHGHSDRALVVVG
jgi:flagellar hook assembly protein FlgD